MVPGQLLEGRHDLAVELEALRGAAKALDGGPGTVRGKLERRRARELPAPEGQAAFATMLRRLPDLRLEPGPLAWRENLGLRGLKALPVAFG